MYVKQNWILLTLHLGTWVRLNNHNYYYQKYHHSDNQDVDYALYGYWNAMMTRCAYCNGATKSIRDVRSVSALSLQSAQFHEELD